MAITFQNSISENKLLFAFNNNIVEFKSDSVLATTKAEVTTAGTTYTLYPSPTSSFWFNFKQSKAVDINIDNFADSTVTDLASSFVYDFANKTIIEDAVVFKIYFSNSTSETTTKNYIWLNGYVSLIDYKKNYPLYDLTINEIHIIQRGAFIKYWEGYPFDFTLYKPNANDFTLLNRSNAVSQLFSITSKVVRLFFSDGRTSTNIENVIPFNYGFNSLGIQSAGLSDVNILLHKENPNCDGIYLKWINSKGGYSYWLFDFIDENIATKDRGVLNNNNQNLNSTISPYISLGKESENQIRIIQENISQNELFILRDIIDSAKVYLFTGVRFSKANQTDWLEVTLKDGTYKISNAKSKQTTLSFSIKIPENETRTL